VQFPAEPPPLPFHVPDGPPSGVAVRPQRHPAQLRLASFQAPHPLEESLFEQNQRRGRLTRPGGNGRRRQFVLPKQIQSDFSYLCPQVS
jgi:hypothetical protein